MSVARELALLCQPASLKEMNTVQTTLLLLVKIGLLLLLWFFIWMTLRSLKKGADRASGLALSTVGSAAAPLNGPPVGYNAPEPGGHGFRRNKAPSSLEITSGPLTGTTLDLEGYEEVSIGRSSSCTLVLEDDFASGTHARLIKRGSDWFVEDEDSRNGTWIGTLRIDQPEKLHAGMEIRIGQTHVRMDG